MQTGVFRVVPALRPSARCDLAAAAGGGPLAALLMSVLLVSALSGCGLVGGPTTFQPESIAVTSPEFGHKIIPARYTCHGVGISPPVHWSDARPPGTKALALVVDDSDAPISPYVYWIVFDINPATTDFQPGQLPRGARQADNSAGRAAYQPFCPHNAPHWYRFTVYALRSVVSLPNGVNLKAAWTAIARAAIARGRLTGIAEP